MSFKTEKEIEDLFVQRCRDLLRPGWKISQQHKIGKRHCEKSPGNTKCVGRVDVVITDASGSWHFAEVKKFKDTVGLIHGAAQLMFYFDFCNTRGIPVGKIALVSDKFTKDATDFISRMFPKIDMIEVSK